MDKKGVSEVVSYVLLIVIAVGIATLVYAFLKVYVPKEKSECKDGINLVISSAECTHTTSPEKNTIKITFENRGLFKVDSAFIRIGQEGKDFKADVPSTNPQTIGSDDDLNKLNPSKKSVEYTFDLPVAYSSNGNYILEIQPAYVPEIRTKEKWTLCPAITERIECK